jgi:hypothetical protein
VLLIFEGVPGLQQASVLDRAVNDVLPNEEINIVQRDRAHPLRCCHAIDVDWLADQLVARLRASVEFDVVAGERDTFRRG